MFYAVEVALSMFVRITNICRWICKYMLSDNFILSLKVYRNFVVLILYFLAPLPRIFMKVAG
jgi:hypothetical protein